MERTEAAMIDPAEFIAPLLAILPRVAAMNSFVRSAAARHGLGGSALANVVYHYKREALIQATGYGLATHRRATVPTKCRDCEGTGKYYDSFGYRHDHCWRCNNSGHVRLQFVETTLPDGIVWLTPREKAWKFMSTAAQDELDETTQNWQINQPGIDLEPSQVAEHLNAIEAFFPKRPEKRYSEYGEHDAFATYTLWIGTTERGKCYLCGAAIDRIYGGHYVRSGRVTWNGIVCKPCEGRCGGKVFETLTPMMPRHFLTPPIAEWIARHPTPIELLERYPRPVRVVATTPACERDDDDIPF